MENNWKNYRFSDVIDLIGGGTPKTSESSYWNGDIPWLSVVDFNTGRKYVSDTEKKITEEGLNNSSTKLLNEGDIIISARGTVGALAVLDKTMAFNQSCYGVRAKEDFSFNDYIFYLLKDTVNNLKQFAHGGVFDTITKDTFKEIEIQLPPLPEQKAIASVLSSLDDKIDLLHQQNQTLEALAETLFRQWFIERCPEPVEGEAKEDWEVLPLSEIAEVKNGKSFKSSDFTDNDFNSYEVVKMGHIERGGGLKLNPKKDFVSREMDVEKWILNKGDIIMAMTDMKDNVVILGVPAMIDKDDHYVLNQRVARIYLKDNSKLISNYLLYIQLNNKDFIAELQTKANSGVQVNLSTEAIKESEILIPPFKLQEEFGHKIIDLYSKIEINREQIQTLTQLRDTLLPKLMSGEVRVKV